MTGQLPRLEVMTATLAAAAVEATATTPTMAAMTTRRRFTRRTRAFAWCVADLRSCDIRHLSFGWAAAARMTTAHAAVVQCVETPRFERPRSGSSAVLKTLVTPIVPAQRACGTLERPSLVSIELSHSQGKLNGPDRRQSGESTSRRRGYQEFRAVGARCKNCGERMQRGGLVVHRERDASGEMARRIHQVFSDVAEGSPRRNTVGRALA